MKGRDPRSGRVYLTPLHCRYLDRRTRLCRVYADRHRQAAWCLSAQQAVTASLVPNECGYAAAIQGYSGPQKLPTKYWLSAEGRAQLRALADRHGVWPAELDAVIRDMEGGTWD